MKFSYIGNQENKDITITGSYANSAFSHANAAFATANSIQNAISGEFDYGLITDVNNTIQDYGTI
jgi:hypothetical protein